MIGNGPFLVNQLQAFEKGVLEALPNYGDIPSFRAGDTLKVHVRIKEGSKERIQLFEGVCIARKNGGIHSSFRVRKLLAGEWIERVFPLYSPLIRIEVSRRGVVRRAKLYYLRGRQGKAARIKERLDFMRKKPKVAAPTPKEAAKAGPNVDPGSAPKAGPNAASKPEDAKSAQALKPEANVAVPPKAAAPAKAPEKAPAEKPKTENAKPESPKAE